MEIFKTLYFISLFVIFWAMIGYPVSIKLIDKLYTSRYNAKDYSNLSSVTVMVVAHNEEKVIYKKLKNLIELDYPKNKLEILVSSDNSTDSTNELVKKFQADYPDERINLYEVKNRKGKLNAQNEAQKLVNTDYIVFTDANSMLHHRSVKELLSSFISSEVCYVTGRLKIVNNTDSSTSMNESNYWSKDIQIREIESKVQTITAGNGALYACRTEDYVDFDPMKSHDINMPLYFALKGKRAISNHDAIAYEKAGEKVEDEFKRKVRMNRRILKHIIPDIRLFNVFNYKWFSYFYFGHRTCRYSLWFAHLLLLISNVILVNQSWLFIATLIGQTVFYGLALMKELFGINNKYISLIHYYCMTVAAQWVGVYNILTGKAKPFWEKAESTR